MVIAVAAVALCTVDRLPAQADRAGRLAERRLPARGARRVADVGRLDGRVHRAAERRRVQLLPSAAGRAVHDSRLQQLGRPGHVRRRRRACELCRGDHACAGQRRPGASARGRPGGRDGASAAARRRPVAGAADGGCPTGPDARAELGGDRDGGRRGRRSDDRLSAARGHPAPGHAARGRRHPRGRACAACRSASCRRWRGC